MEKRNKLSDLRGIEKRLSAEFKDEFDTLPGARCRPKGVYLSQRGCRRIRDVAAQGRSEFLGQRTEPAIGGRERAEEIRTSPPGKRKGKSRKGKICPIPVNRGTRS